MPQPTSPITPIARLVRYVALSKTRQSVAVALLALALRYAYTRRRKTRKLIHDLGLAGSPLGSDRIYEYDVIVVGGGTAGCVLASRLSENPAIRVLLLEAGQSASTQLLSRIPSGFAQLFLTEHDYNLYTVPQENAKGRACYWPRAKMLGGCSANNAMMYHHGAPSDYDEWANIVKDKEWSYSQLTKYFRKFEKYSPNPKHPLVQVDNRGADGPVSIGHGTWSCPVTSAFVDACDATGITISPDLNTSSGGVGATHIMTYIDKNGQRVTTESSYLTTEVLRRPNLTVVVGARATRILIDSSSDGEPRAVGVEFTSSAQGRRFCARARREVVLSAGAIHTPQLLLISGIGPAEHLVSQKIPVNVDLPGVGSRLMDHIAIGTWFRETTGTSLGFLKSPGIMNTIRARWALIKWLTTGRGPLASNIGEGASFTRTTNELLFKGEHANNPMPEDTTSGPNAPDVEFIFAPVAFKQHGFGRMPPGDIVSIMTVLLRPKSEGTIRLSSSNVFDPPIIDPQYLSAPNDLTTLMRGVRLALKIARTSPLSECLDQHEPDPSLDHHLYEADDSHLADVVRERAETLYHPCCTARMAPLEDGGVVNSRLRVYGIRGLRIADASVFPQIIAGHTSAPVIAIAEKCADMMKEDFMYFK